MNEQRKEWQRDARQYAYDMLSGLEGVTNAEWQAYEDQEAARKREDEQREDNDE